MKRLLTLVGLACVGVLVGCTAEAGPVGPQGDQGLRGEQGDAADVERLEAGRRNTRSLLPSRMFDSNSASARSRVISLISARASVSTPDASSLIWLADHPTSGPKGVSGR